MDNLTGVKIKVRHQQLRRSDQQTIKDMVMAQHGILGMRQAQGQAVDLSMVAEVDGTWTPVDPTAIWFHGCAEAKHLHSSSSSRRRQRRGLRSLERLLADTADGQTTTKIRAVWAERALRGAELKPLRGGAGDGAGPSVAGVATLDLTEVASVGRAAPSPALYASERVGLTLPRPTRSI